MHVKMQQTEDGPVSSSVSMKKSKDNNVLSSIISEEKSLLQLWSLLIHFLLQPDDQLHRQSPDTWKPEQSTIEEDENQLAMLTVNPLSDEFWMQAATGDLDEMLLRFLRARKGNVNEALRMIIDCMHWRKNFGVRELLKEGERGVKPHLLELGESYWWKPDKQGRQTIYLRSALHDRAKQTAEDMMRWTVHQIEIGRRLMFGMKLKTMMAGQTTQNNNDNSRVTLVFDMNNAGIASFDLPSIQFIVQCMQNYYPESLGKALVINAPWMFSSFYALVKPLLDPVVTAKIEFITIHEVGRSEGSASTTSFISSTSTSSSFDPISAIFFGSGSSRRNSASPASTLTMTSNQSMNPLVEKYFDPNNLPATYGGVDPYQYVYLKPEQGKENQLPKEPLSQEQQEEHLKFIEIEKTKFITFTLKLIDNDDKSDDVVDKIMQQRNESKRKLTELYLDDELRSIPQNHYHRLGIIDSNGHVDWSRI